MEKLLELYPQIISNQIQEVLVNGGPGISCLNMGFNPPIEKMQSYDIQKHNSFILDVPYAGKHLKWNVMYNDDNICFGPDFDFLNDDFLSDPDEELIETEIPSLCDWKATDCKSLLQVIKELLVLYKKCQVEKLSDNKFHRHLMEYMLLTGDIGIPEEDIEVLVESKDSVLFYILIRVPLYTLPPYYNLDNMESGFLLNPSEDAAILRVRFGCNGVFPNLQLSPRLENIVGNSKELHIPQYSKDSGLIEYVPAVSALITNKLDAISKSYKARNDFISALIAHQGKSLQEYDSVAFFRASILFEIENNRGLIILTINLGHNFPLQKPELIISTISLDNNDFNETISKFPYNPRWKEERMAKDLFMYIKKICSNFVSKYT